MYPIVRTGIKRYGAADDGWLDVDAAPGAAPNTGAFFCPFFFSAMNGNTCTGNVFWSLEWAFTIECRGSKL